MFCALMMGTALLAMPLAHAEEVLATPVATTAEIEAVAPAAQAGPVRTTTTTTTTVTTTTTEPLEAAPAAAEEGPKIDSGNTAWMLASTALVLLMTIPGLALFYGGMVRKKNILATMMQSFAITALMTVLWTVVGYSLAFSEGTPWVGGLSKMFLNGIGVNTVSGTIPESVFVIFQMTFAIITPALICGAFAERMKFSSMLVFMTLWSLFVYAPVTHWVWAADGWLFNYHPAILDYAGGTVVHVNAGVAGIVCAFMLGKRVGFGREAMPPHNLALTLTGASLLWVGWFGFNAGSALAADGRAGMAMAATQIATGTAALAWMFAEWFRKGSPSVLGITSGAVSGLVAITPAAGFVDPKGALIIGAIAGVLCYWGATGLKRMLGADDSLDAFGVHGVGGTVGAILTGFFVSKEISGVDAGLSQVVTQLVGVGSVALYGAVVTFIILIVIDLVMDLRVPEDDERMGLDLSLHRERVE
ncbi:MAG: ammonium transporter [Pedobacter sp.]|nr:ammonium transporter [Pedobacter sp.]